MDVSLHQYFTDLGLAIGFETNQTWSLYEIPAMLSKLDKEDFKNPIVPELFLYSQHLTEPMFTDKKLFLHYCFERWVQFMEMDEIPPDHIGLYVIELFYMLTRNKHFNNLKLQN